MNHQQELDAMPYLPKGKTVQWVSANHPYMQLAKETALNKTSDHKHPTGAIIVKANKIIGKAANYSAYHHQHGCERKKRGCRTGEGYELCEGCHPKHHAEPSALRNAQAQGHHPKGATLYLWGHWWCCKDCWEAMIEADIENVYLEENARQRLRPSST